ncbi:MAG: hypothetical protein IPO31_16500 [Candidatus Obscuribacter sp.]|nr:hypothetical protein [Candidatus Obscuribacter sp.]
MSKSSKFKELGKSASKQNYDNPDASILEVFDSPFADKKLIVIPSLVPSILRRLSLLVSVPSLGSLILPIL